MREAARRLTRWLPIVRRRSPNPVAGWPADLIDGLAIGAALGAVTALIGGVADRPWWIWTAWSMGTMGGLSLTVRLAARRLPADRSRWPADVFRGAIMGAWIAVFVSLLDRDSLPSPYVLLWWIAGWSAFEAVVGWRRRRRQPAV